MTISVSNGPRQQDPPRQPVRRRVLIYVGALIAGVAAAFASGLGQQISSTVTKLVEGDKPIVTASAVETAYECGTALYVPDERDARDIAAGRLPTPEWSQFRKKYDAAAAGRSVVQLSIQGESERKVTLTGVRLRVDRRAFSEKGATFTHPCGDGLIGRSVAFDIDQAPPRITDSVADPDGMLGAITGGQRATKPIEFPWTVDVKDPLQLQVVAASERCFCSFDIEVTWQSGGKVGTLKLDNDGKGFAVSPNVNGYISSEGESDWRPFAPPPTYS